jgi:hypothetical protein
VRKQGKRKAVKRMKKVGSEIRRKDKRRKEKQ